MTTPAAMDGIAAALHQLQPGRGVMVLVVGASGSGKDTLIAWLKRQPLACDPLFVRRIVTRLDRTGSEDHLSLSEDTFAQRESEGRFAATWQAHGLHYGLPAIVNDHIGHGGVAIANGSRAALPALREAFANRLIVHLKVSPAVLAARLAGRGRETEEDIAARLRRRDFREAWSLDTVHVENDGPVEAAGMALVTLLDAATERLGRTDQKSPAQAL